MTQKIGYDQAISICERTSRKMSVCLVLFHETERIPKYASGLIVKASDRCFLVTAGHVITEAIELGSFGRLQIGGLGHVIEGLSEDVCRIHNNIDIGIIGLSDKVVDQIGWSVFDYNAKIYDLLCENDGVIYTGYPGCLKKIVSETQLEVTGLLFNARVNTVEDDQFSIRISPEYYEQHTSQYSKIADLGGISGSPVFRFYDSSSEEFENVPLLVGVITEARIFHSGDDQHVVNEQKHYGVHVNALRELLG